MTQTPTSKILKRVYKKPTLWVSLRQLFGGLPPKQDHYPYIVNIGYHNGVVNLVTHSPTPSDVLVNGNKASLELIEEILEKIKVQFHYKECGYTLEEV